MFYRFSILLTFVIYTTALLSSRTIYSVRNKLRLFSSLTDDEPAMRIGHGWDIHRLIEGTDLVIGGVKIPHSLGADAHSDGDALYHCVVDSILGALTLPDIGQIFPDNDPKWKGIYISPSKF